MIWTDVRSGCCKSDEKPKLQQQKKSTQRVDVLRRQNERKCPESIPFRSGFRAQCLTHNNNNILLEEIEVNDLHPGEGPARLLTNVFLPPIIGRNCFIHHSMMHPVPSYPALLF
jgi:hypothetical protein